MMRNGWRSLLPLLLLAAGVAYIALMCWRAPDSRLYWEYAGRLNHQSFTDGYPEWVRHRTGDLKPPEAARRGDRALAPYTEFASEYPPGALLLFAAVRLPFDGLRAFSLAYAILVAIGICLAAVVMISLAERRSGDPRTAALVAAAFTVWAGLTGPFVVTRFDSVVVLCVALGLLAGERRSRTAAGFCLGLGASIKLWPALLVPILALSSPRGAPSSLPAARHGWPIVIGALIGFALPHGVMLALGTAPSNIFDYLAYHGGRPPEVESLQGNLLAIGGILAMITATPDFDFGSHNVIAANWQTLSRLFFLAFGASYLAALFCVLRGSGSRRAETSAMGFVVIALILGSKVFSGEYLIWMLPFALLAVADRQWGTVAAYAAALLFLKGGYWNWNAVIALQPFGTFLVALKNGACLAMACLLAREMARGGAGRQDPDKSSLLGPAVPGGRGQGLRS